MPDGFWCDFDAFIVAILSEITVDEEEVVADFQNIFHVNIFCDGMPSLQLFLCGMNDSIQLL